MIAPAELALLRSHWHPVTTSAALDAGPHHVLVWVCLGEPAAEPPDWSVFDSPDRQRFQSPPARWKVSGSRVAKNFNDVAHFSTIHAETFGPSERPVGAQTIIETPEGFTSEVGVHQRYRNTRDGAVEEVEAAYRYDFTFPFSSMLTITYPDGEVERVQMTAMPGSVSSSLVFQPSVRTNLGDGPRGAWRDFQTAVNEEDRMICESLRPSAESFSLNGSGEIALPADVFSVAYRPRWRSLLAT